MARRVIRATVKPPRRGKSNAPRSPRIAARLLGTAVEIVYRHTSGQLRKHEFSPKKHAIGYTDNLLHIANVRVSDFIED